MKFALKQPNLLYGILITLAAYFCFAVAATIVRSFDVNFPTIQIIFFQCVISLIFILPQFFQQKLYHNHISKDIFLLNIIRSITGVLSFFCYFFAIKKLNLVDATVLTYTAPFFTPLIWSFWTKEKPEKGIWWTIVLGFLGIALILKPTYKIFKIGALIGILAGIFSAIALIAIKRLNQKKDPLIRTLFFYFFLGSVGTLPFTIFQWQSPSSEQYILLISIGILMALGQFFLVTGYKHGTASFLSPIAYSMIIFTGIIYLIIAKQFPKITSIIGAFLIIIGGSISYIIKIKPTKWIEVFEHPKEDKIPLLEKVKFHNHHIEIHKHKKTKP